MTYAHKQARDGFTLIELMIAIAVLAIISIVVVPNIMKYREDAKRSVVSADLQAFKGAITQYNLSMGQWPSRLKDLTQPPTDDKLKKKWTGSFFEKEISEDPWGERYQYKVISEPGAPHPYELYSFGKSGKGAPKAEWISVWDKEVRVYSY